MADEGVIAVDRAVALLEAFRPGEEAVSLAQLAARTELHKTTVLRLAASLERAGLLMRMPGGSFRLGGRILALANVYRSSLHLDRVVRPFLETLVQETGESASFYLREGKSRLCMARIETPRPLRVAITEGSLAPLDDTATGLVLRGLRPASAPDRASPSDPVFTSGVGDAETASASAPVLSTAGEILGALTVSGPASRFTAEVAARAMPSLAHTAHAFSAFLAGAPPPRPSPAPKRGRAASSTPGIPPGA
jgi:DNA-binding IclR family transcriptional regulator